MLPLIEFGAQHFCDEILKSSLKYHVPFFFVFDVVLHTAQNDFVAVQHLMEN